MQDRMGNYGVVSNPPYDERASRNDNRDYRRAARGYAGAWQGQMSGDDQHKFNEEYRKWQGSMAKNDRADVGKHAGKMEEVMALSNIPQSTPFDPSPNTNRYPRHSDYRVFQVRSS